MFIGIAATIPDLPNLPGQGGEGGPEVTLDYSSSNFCKNHVPNPISPTDATPAGGTFSYTGTGTLNLVSNSGVINIQASESGSYTIIYTVGGSSSSFPITIGNEIILSITPSPGAAICTGDTATLTANASGGSGGFTYSWNTTPVQTTQSIDVTTSGAYTVTVTDSSGCTGIAFQTITVSTAATTIASINNAAAMSFNGVDSYVDTTSVNLGVNATTTMWFKPNVGGSTDYTLFGEAGSGFQYLARRSNTSFFVWIGSGSVNGTDYINYTTIPSNIITGEWNFISLVKTGGTVVVYLKNSGGEFSESKTSSAWATRSMDFDRIGARTGGVGAAGRPSFDGLIDEVAAWSTSLSTCDIKGIYEGSTGSNAGKAANLLDTNTTIPAPVYWNRMGDS